MNVGEMRYRGRTFSADDLMLVTEVVTDCSGLSRTELARTVCELLEWKRPNGGYRTRECSDFLGRLEKEQKVILPARKMRRPFGSSTSVPVSTEGDPGERLEGTVRDFAPVQVKLVEDNKTRSLYRELIGRYHYLGHRMPFGASLRYLVYISKPTRQVAGAVQFSSPAWRMTARDRWIGWDDEARQRNLQRIVNNSRFLLLPWVQVKNLASTVLSMVAKQIKKDWPERYALEPLLLETLVDETRYQGSCYRAANWVSLEKTTGRGRMDRFNERHGAAPKRVLVYPLVRNAARRLREA